MTDPVSDQERLFKLLAMLPWRHTEERLYPPDALRSLMPGVDADTTPDSDAAVDDRWSPLFNVAFEFGRLLAKSPDTKSKAVFRLAMRVLDTFEPFDVEVAKAVGRLLPVETAGRLWVEDITATAWRIVSSTHGGQLLGELRHERLGTLPST